MLRVAAIGGLDDRVLPGKRVLVGPKRLPGLIGAKPVHLMEDDEREKVIKLEAMRIDIGAASKSAAEGKAPLGTRIGFDSIFQPIGKLISGKALDNRVGCSVLIHLLQAERFPFDVVGVFAVQEEVGLRGARVAAQSIGPDCAIVLEGTIADDLPSDKDQSPTTVPGKGPALSLMDRSTLFDPRLTEHFTRTAEAHKIPVQLKQPGVGGTDAGSIHITGSGVPSVAISTPCRYIHSPAALLDRRDYQNCIALVDAGLRGLNRDVLKR
jgi:endoglucanase